MVYTPSQLGDWDIQPGAPRVSRYRFVIHDGDIYRPTVEELLQGFAEPLVTSVACGRGRDVRHSAIVVARAIVW